MSVSNTNTPNGDSNRDLYEKNEDVGKQQLAVADMSEKDPSKDLTGNVPGDNTISEESIIIDNSTAIRDFGNVRIGATLVGEPVKVGQDSENRIKLTIADVKKMIIAKGALNIEDYIHMKNEKIEEKSKKIDKENDKDEDALEDRNQ